ncbi:MAG: hypothetical protein LBQ14_07425 [Treponema sp.]|jgi:hypothetical protein|nr:hypothetical protein [Treponema sp.]
MKKIIHRIFFNFDNKPDPFLPYLKTWREQLPDFEIMEWNKDNLPLNLNAYTSYMAQKKNHAYLSDYFRCWLLSKYGGAYLDADIEILNGEKFREIYTEAQTADDYTLFIGIESVKTGGLTPHSMGIKCGETHPLLNFLMNLYETAFTTPMKYVIGKFPMPDVVSLYFMELEENGYTLSRKGCFFDLSQTIITGGIKIYSQDYFSPTTNYNNNMMLSAYSENTCLCHHFAATWRNAQNQKQGQLFADLLYENYYVIPPSFIPILKKNYIDLKMASRKPSWTLNAGEIQNIEKILNGLVPYGGILHTILRKFRKK